MTVTVSDEHEKLTTDEKTEIVILLREIGHMYDFAEEGTEIVTKIYEDIYFSYIKISQNSDISKGELNMLISKLASVK